jgi:hypothetical protein
VLAYAFNEPDGLGILNLHRIVLYFH